MWGMLLQFLFSSISYRCIQKNSGVFTSSLHKSSAHVSSHKQMHGRMCQWFGFVQFHKFQQESGHDGRLDIHGFYISWFVNIQFGVFVFCIIFPSPANTFRNVVNVVDLSYLDKVFFLQKRKQIDLIMFLLKMPD